MTRRVFAAMALGVACAATAPVQTNPPWHEPEVKMVPPVVDGDRTTSLVFLGEGLEAESTGKHTTAKDMSTTGV